MIIREMSMRSGKAESLPHLVDYMESGRDGLHPDERVLAKWTANCQERDPVLAQAEILAAASLNTRSKSQKYAHIVMSPAPGEELTLDEWKEAAQALARKLGLEKHQYFCYVHKDTDQQHLHFIANLIDPRTHARNSLPWSRRREQELAQELEERFRLRRIDHSAKNSREAALARDMERKTGQESLFTYIMKFKPELEQAATWQEFHEALARHGIKATLLQGRGLRLEAQGAVRPAAEKASALGKEFSFARLEERFGPWQEPGPKAAAQERAECYEAKPVDYGAGISDREKLRRLFDEYRSRQDANRDARRRLLDAERLREQADEDALEQIKAEAEEAARAAAAGNRAAQKAALAEARRRWRLERRRIRKEAAARRAKIRRETASSSFQDWLRRLREPADADPARDVLETREGALGTPALNGIAGLQIIMKITVAEAGFFTLAKRTGKGQDIFTSPWSQGDMIRDLGYRITCNDKPSLITVLSLLQLGKERYGDQPPLRVFGTQEFQKQAAIAASEAGISIRCDDPKAQQYYEDLEEDQYERQQRIERVRELAEKPGGLEGGIGGGFEGYAELSSFAATISIFRAGSFDYGRRSGRRPGGAGTGRSGGRSGWDAAGHRGARKPGFDRAGEGEGSAPARFKGRVQEVQGRDLDEDRERGGVLLHGDEAENVGEHGLDELHGDVRREVPGREAGAGRGGAQDEGGGLNEAIEAARAYAAERNSKRAMGMRSIPEHAVWNGEAGGFTYRGYRTLGMGANCLLLEKDGRIYIKISSSYEKKRLSKLGRGARVEVSASGRVSVARRRSSQGLGGQGRK